ncbi:MAG: helix-turn-helix domain-containing protein, partial [Clostridia bacterium]|nr:helix-turn-helix domain-containing protein [Clostridia bacterium]
YVMEKNFDVKKIKIISCGITDCGPEWHWDTGEGGFHDYDLWTVFRGRGVLICGGDSWESTVGDSLLLPPNTRCVGVRELNDNMLTLNVHFYFLADGKPIFPFLGGAVHRKLNDVSFMRDVLFRVIQLFNAGKEELAEAVFSSALVEFFEQESIADDSAFGNDKGELIRKVCDMINTSPANVPPLKEMAKKYGYSPDYFGRVFTSAAGIPISEYIKNAKLNQAKLMLASTSMTVEEIADELGYYDACYFSRQFKRETGCTPMFYRKNKK